MNVVITNAGLNAIINAEQTGTNQVKISKIGFGSGQYEASSDQTELQDEIKRLDVFSGGVESSTNSVHVATQDSTSDAYSVYEVGAFCEDEDGNEILFAVYSQDEPILQKSSNSAAQFEFGFGIVGASVQSITFGDVDFSYPYATENAPGILQIATTAEAQAGTSSDRILTPAGLQGVTASEARKGIAEIATNEEAEAGTDDTRIITPKKLKNVLGESDMSNARVIAKDGNVVRSLKDRFKDFLNPLDVGAVGDGTTNDTSAFVTLESKVTGRDVNLFGRTYLVNAIPTGNNYYNGNFKIGTVVHKAAYDFFKFGGTSENYLNVMRDFSEATRGGGMLLAADFVRKGTGAGAVVQSAVVDTVNRYLYTLHVTSSGPGVINRFPLNKLGSGVTIYADAYSAVGNYVGHQGLGIEYRSGGTVKLWVSFPYEGETSLTTVSKGTKAVRFNPPTGNGTNVDSGAEVFNLFPEVPNSNQATSVCVSYSGKYLIAKYNEPNNVFWVRIFRISDFTSAGDYSNKFIHEFRIVLTNDDTTTGVSRALQGIACDDRNIYFLATATGYSNKHSIYVTDMFGNKIDEYRDLSLGKEIGRAVGTTFFEPESLFFAEINGTTKLCMQLATGDTTGQRLCHVVVPNCKQSWFFGTGNSNGGFGGVGIDDSARMTNAEGKDNFSLYPSGLPQEMTARAAAVQKVLARFSNDASGVNQILYKSRGSSVRESRSVLPEDIIGAIHWLVDNGNIDYDGTTQGARAAYIEALVHSGSTQTSAGSTSIGIRGLLRLLTCDDGDSRSGTGLEILSGEIRPTGNNTHSLGTSSRRWSNVYAANGTIQTSDENYKTDIDSLSEKMFAAWEKVEYVSFKFKDSVQSKGEKARRHIGLIAQRIVQAFESEGLDAFEFGLICKDKDENGNDFLMLRYDECFCLESAYQRYLIRKILTKLS